jgi:hypothetical protein
VMFSNTNFLHSSIFSSFIHGEGISATRWQLTTVNDCTNKMSI